MTPLMLALADHLWQSTLFAGVIWLAARMLRRQRAEIRHRLWVAASLKFALPFSLLVSAGALIGWPAADAPAAAPAVFAGQVMHVPWLAESQAGAVAQTGRAPVIAPLLFAIWIGGVVVCAATWCWRWQTIRRLARAAPALAIDAPIAVRSCAAPLEPGVFGILKPVLLLPDRIADHLTADELRAVVAHETCHVRRADNAIMAIHMAIAAIFWFHPLVWWIERRLIVEQERACDEEVLRGGVAADVYAAGILKVCELYVTPSLPCIARVTGPALNTRIEAIMLNRPPLALGMPRRIALAMLVVVTLSVPIIAGAVSAQAVDPAWLGTWRMNIPETKFPDPSGQRIGANPYADGYYRLRIDPAPGGLTIALESQPNRSSAVFHEEMRVTFDGAEQPFAHPVIAGRTVAFERLEAGGFVIVRRVPEQDGTTRVLTQRYVFSADGSTLTWTWHGENPPRAWQIGVLVFDKVR